MSAPSAKSIHVQATMDEYRLFPMRLGYKHEYYAGKIHQTPSHMAAAVLQLDTNASTRQ